MKFGVHDMTKVKECLHSINTIIKLQDQKAHRETQRNRRLHSMSLSQYSNSTTVGRAYYNLNKTSQAFPQISPKQQKR